MGFFKKSEVKKNYELGKDLGSGNFAVVKEGTKTAANKTAEIPNKVAIKVIDKAKVEDMNDIQREIEVMSMLDHPNVVKLFEIYDEPKKMMLVMELVTGGELFDRIVAKGSYTEKDAAEVMKTLCQALSYMHAKKVVHRDLKPENILYSDPSESAAIRVADFGLARVVSGKEMMKTACGTPGYVAPEVLKNKGYDSGAVDMWSAGVILYILLCGFPPFYEEELPALFEQILHARYDFPSPWWDNISQDAKSLVTALLTIDPKQRATAEDVLQKKWITGNAPNNDLSSTKTALKKYNASRKMKKAAAALMAQNRMAKLLEAGRANQ
jgi:serine/threonine protein kinase